jgi:polyhydroxyalkanoate synthase subunit PhaE
MQTPGSSTAFKPEEAYAAAAARFFEMMKSFGVSGATTDWKSLAGPLASQFERWLQMSQAASPWFGAAGGGAPGAAGFGFPGAAAFGALPLGPAAAQGAQMPRSLELLGRLAQLQRELAKHWSEIATTAAQRFIARLGSAPAAPATPAQALQLYELWVNCAEEAYAATVHREDFGRLQSELTNTFAALMAEQRQQTEALVRAFGLPTREEVDALFTQLKELRRQVAGLAPRPAHPQAEPARQSAAVKRRAKAPASRRSAPARRKRARARGTRR